MRIAPTRAAREPAEARREASPKSPPRPSGGRPPQSAPRAPRTRAGPHRTGSEGRAGRAVRAPPSCTCGDTPRRWACACAHASFATRCADANTRESSAPLRTLPVRIAVRTAERWPITAVQRSVRERRRYRSAHARGEAYLTGRTADARGQCASERRSGRAARRGAYAHASSLSIARADCTKRGRHAIVFAQTSTYCTGFGLVHGSSGSFSHQRSTWPTPASGDGHGGWAASQCSHGQARHGIRHDVQ
jgi:hypothetical protein